LRRTKKVGIGKGKRGGLQYLQLLLI
jgi:hypothetical protein